MKQKILGVMSILTLIGVGLFTTPLAFAQGKIHTSRLTRIENRLNQEVKDGKLTQAQEQLIVAELQKLDTNKTQLKNMTKAQRRAFFQTKRTDFLNWAKQNGINPTLVFGAPHGVHFRHR
ncbi:MAG TPA: hypothetical protein VF820_07150 [Patescibacteria group bacterium]